MDKDCIAYNTLIEIVNDPSGYEVSSQNRINKLLHI